MAKLFEKKDNRLVVLSKFNNKCAYCGCDLEIRTLCIDHLIPKRRGTYQTKFDSELVDCIENFMPCCKACNSSKGSMLLEVWREELYLKINRLLKHSSTYRAALKFNLVAPTNNPVIFYFETLSNG